MHLWLLLMPPIEQELFAFKGKYIYTMKFKSETYILIAY